MKLTVLSDVILRNPAIVACQNFTQTLSLKPYNQWILLNDSNEMKKAAKKLENVFRKGLTDICEHDLKAIDGFQWVTHLVDYDRFPDSLKIVLIFDTEKQVSAFKRSAEKMRIDDRIEMLMSEHNIKLKSVSQHVLYDNETDCALQHNGDWVKRLALVS